MIFLTLTGGLLVNYKTTSQIMSSKKLLRFALIALEFSRINRCGDSLMTEHFQLNLDTISSLKKAVLEAGIGSTFGTSKSYL